MRRDDGGMNGWFIGSLLSELFGLLWGAFSDWQKRPRRRRP